jgi:uncharacterized Zn finger protein (UPF0148 family)
MVTCECGCPEVAKDERDGIVYCPMCGLIPEPNPNWALTIQDIHDILKFDEKNKPSHNEPRMNDKGYKMYKEHSYELLKRLGVE